MPYVKCHAVSNRLLFIDFLVLSNSNPTILSHFSIIKLNIWTSPVWLINTSHFLRYTHIPRPSSNYTDYTRFTAVDFQNFIHSLAFSFQPLSPLFVLTTSTSCRLPALLAVNCLWEWNMAWQIFPVLLLKLKQSLFHIKTIALYSRHKQKLIFL